MDMLSQLALPSLGYKQMDEVAYHMNAYDELCNNKDMRINKEARKKEILLNTFDLLSGIFDLDFDQRLVFYKNDSFAISLIDIDNRAYPELFHELFEKCFIKYIEKMHTFKDNRISDDIYSISKLALLNNEEQIIKAISDKAYDELLVDLPWLKQNVSISKIDIKDVYDLIGKNETRNNSIKQSVMQYKAYHDLSNVAVRNVFKCFSIDIFGSLNKEEKAHLMNLLYNYFSLEDKMDKYPKYKKMISDKSTNKECLQVVIEDLKLPGKTMIVMKKNKDIVKDVLSWMDVIYANETQKENINSLDELYELLKQNKKL